MRFVIKPTAVNQGAVSRRVSAGANLVELALVLPFIFVFAFMMVEMARAWQTYEATRMASLDGAYTASITQNPALGVQQATNRLNGAGIQINNVTITPVQARDGTGTALGYRADVRTTFNPVIANFWGIRIFPAGVQMAINEVYYNGVY